MSKLPDGPWLDVSMDFCGPLPTGDNFIVVIYGHFLGFNFIPYGSNRLSTSERITIWLSK